MRMPQSLQENKGISAPWVNSSNNSSYEKCAPTLFKAPTARFAVSSTAVCGEPNFQRDATTACWIDTPSSGVIPSTGRVGIRRIDYWTIVLLNLVIDSLISLMSRSLAWVFGVAVIVPLIGQLWLFWILIGPLDDQVRSLQ